MDTFLNQEYFRDNNGVTLEENKIMVFPEVIDLRPEIILFRPINLQPLF